MIDRTSDPRLSDDIAYLGDGASAKIRMNRDGIILADTFDYIPFSIEQAKLLRDWLNKVLP